MGYWQSGMRRWRYEMLRRRLQRKKAQVRKLKLEKAFLERKLEHANKTIKNVVDALRHLYGVLPADEARDEAREGPPEDAA